MALSFRERMLDRPWLARHAMRRHAVDFEAFRVKALRSFGVVTALAEARRLRDAGQDVTEAVARLEQAKAHGDVDPEVTLATHARLNNRVSPSDVDATYVMDGIRKDAERRYTHIWLRQRTRWISSAAVLFSFVVAYLGLGWAWDNTDSLRGTYQAAILSYQDAEPKSLRQKAADVVGASKSLFETKKAELDQKLDDHRAKSQQKTDYLIDDIKRRRGDATSTN